MRINTGIDQEYERKRVIRMATIWFVSAIAAWSLTLLLGWALWKIL